MNIWKIVFFAGVVLTTSLYYEAPENTSLVNMGQSLYRPQYSDLAYPNGGSRYVGNVAAPAAVQYFDDQQSSFGWNSSPLVSILGPQASFQPQQSSAYVVQTQTQNPIQNTNPVVKQNSFLIKSEDYTPKAINLPLKVTNWSGPSDNVWTSAKIEYLNTQDGNNTRIPADIFKSPEVTSEVVFTKADFPKMTVPQNTNVDIATKVSGAASAPVFEFEQKPLVFGPSNVSMVKFAPIVQSTIASIVPAAKPEPLASIPLSETLAASIANLEQISSSAAPVVAAPAPLQPAIVATEGGATFAPAVVQTPAVTDVVNTPVSTPESINVVQAQPVQEIQIAQAVPAAVQPAPVDAPVAADQKAVIVAAAPAQAEVVIAQSPAVSVAAAGDQTIITSVAQQQVDAPAANNVPSVVTVSSQPVVQQAGDAAINVVSTNGQTQTTVVAAPEAQPIILIDNTKSNVVDSPVAVSQISAPEASGSGASVALTVLNADANKAEVISISQNNEQAAPVAQTIVAEQVNATSVADSDAAPVIQNVVVSAPTTAPLLPLEIQNVSQNTTGVAQFETVVQVQPDQQVINLIEANNASSLNILPAQNNAQSSQGIVLIDKNADSNLNAAQAQVISVQNSNLPIVTQDASTSVNSDEIVLAAPVAASVQTSEIDSANVAAAPVVITQPAPVSITVAPILDNNNAAAAEINNVELTQVTAPAAPAVQEVAGSQTVAQTQPIVLEAPVVIQKVAENNVEILAPPQAAVPEAQEPIILVDPIVQNQSGQNAVAVEAVQPVVIAEPPMPMVISEPVLPVIAAQPVQPIVLVDPVPPVLAAEPANPVIIAEPIQPVVAVEAPKPVEQNVVIEPVQPLIAVDPIQPLISVQPVVAVQPAAPAVEIIELNQNAQVSSEKSEGIDVGAITPVVLSEPVQVQTVQANITGPVIATAEVGAVPVIAAAPQIITETKSVTSTPAQAEIITLAAEVPKVEQVLAAPAQNANDVAQAQVVLSAPVEVAATPVPAIAQEVKVEQIPAAPVELTSNVVVSQVAPVATVPGVEIIPIPVQAPEGAKDIASVSQVTAVAPVAAPVEPVAPVAPATPAEPIAPVIVAIPQPVEQVPVVEIKQDIVATNPAPAAAAQANATQTVTNSVLNFGPVVPVMDPFSAAFGASPVQTFFKQANVDLTPNLDINKISSPLNGDKAKVNPTSIFLNSNQTSGLKPTDIIQTQNGPHGGFSWTNYNGGIPSLEGMNSNFGWPSFENLGLKNDVDFDKMFKNAPLLPPSFSPSALNLTSKGSSWNVSSINEAVTTTTTIETTPQGIIGNISGSVSSVNQTTDPNGKLVTAANFDPYFVELTSGKIYNETDSEKIPQDFFKNFGPLKTDGFVGNVSAAQDQTFDKFTPKIPMPTLNMVDSFLEPLPSNVPVGNQSVVVSSLPLNKESLTSILKNSKSVASAFSQSNSEEMALPKITLTPQEGPRNLIESGSRVNPFLAPYVQVQTFNGSFAVATNNTSSNDDIDMNDDEMDFAESSSELKSGTVSNQTAVSSKPAVTVSGSSKVDLTVGSVVPGTNATSVLPIVVPAVSSAPNSGVSVNSRSNPDLSYFTLPNGSKIARTTQFSLWVDSVSPDAALNSAVNAATATKTALTNTLGAAANAQAILSSIPKVDASNAPVLTSAMFNSNSTSAVKSSPVVTVVKAAPAPKATYVQISLPTSSSVSNSTISANTSSASTTAENKITVASDTAAAATASPVNGFVIIQQPCENNNRIVVPKKRRRHRYEYAGLPHIPVYDLNSDNTVSPSTNPFVQVHDSNSMNSYSYSTLPSVNPWHAARNWEFSPSPSDYASTAMAQSVLAASLGTWMN